MNQPEATICGDHPQMSLVLARLASSPISSCLVALSTSLESVFQNCAYYLICYEACDSQSTYKNTVCTLEVDRTLSELWNHYLVSDEFSRLKPTLVCH